MYSKHMFWMDTEHYWNDQLCVDCSHWVLLVLITVDKKNVSMLY